MPLFQYRCQECGQEVEKLMKHSDPVPECHGEMKKQFTVPAFKFKNGKGTDMGNSMAIPGYSLPQV